MEGTPRAARGGAVYAHGSEPGAAGLLRAKLRRRLGGSEEQSGLNEEQGNTLPAPRRGCPLAGRPRPFARSALFDLLRFQRVTQTLRQTVPATVC